MRCSLVGRRTTYVLVNCVGETKIIFAKLDHKEEDSALRGQQPH